MKTTTVGLAIVVSLGWSLGCAGAGLEPPPPPPPPPQPQLDLQGTDPRRDVLVHGAAEAADLAVYGYLVLPRRQERALDVARQRAVRVCEAYQRLPPFEGVPTQPTFVTYWPVRTAQVRLDDDCESLVEAYDDDRLDGLRTCLRLDGRPGPVLVAQAVPYRTTTGIERIVLDLSDVATSELDHVIDEWKHFTVEPPSHPTVYNALESLAAFIVNGSFAAAHLSRPTGGCP